MTKPSILPMRQILGMLILLLMAGDLFAIAPKVMLVMSRDDQWFFEAYPDNNDLDGDGAVETTYRDDFEYAGYFHPRRCYRYPDQGVNGVQRFVPVGVAGGANLHYCDNDLDDAWSGNFLNWATMTRIDLLRQALYGGYRATDTPALTVLERAHLPSDGHAFAKYYNGADLARLVPFNNLKVDAANGGDNDGVDDRDEGITLCNVSYKSAGSSQGTTSTTPSEIPNPAPILRVAKTNYQLWDTNEVMQCTWEDEFHISTNNNSRTVTGIDASIGDPSNADVLRTQNNARDHLVRIESCAPSFFDSSNNAERCYSYPSGLKPEGVLQAYARDSQVEFGLVTGSYVKNLSGGVLRKAMGGLADEVNFTDGTFVPRTGTQPGIIRTLNALRIFGYSYSSGTYFGASSGDNCPYQQTSHTNGSCRNWGNPIAETYLEAARYFAVGEGRAPTPLFDADDSGSIAGLVRDGWTSDPLQSAIGYQPLNLVVLIAGPNSYDDDALTQLNALVGDAKQRTTTIGEAENLEGLPVLIGRTGQLTNGFCITKTLTSLGNIAGICPENPTLGGSYLTAGLAHFARTTDLRQAAPGPQRVRTFAIEAPYRVPTFEIPLTDRKVLITPAYRLRRGGNSLNEALNDGVFNGGGRLTRAIIVTPHRMVMDALSTAPAEAGANTGHFYGKFYLAWDDTEYGADFDQDTSGVLEYRVNTNVVPATVSVSTHLFASNGGGYPQLFGFVIQGTTQDGFHAYSGFKGNSTTGANFTDPSGVLGCVACAVFGSEPTGPGNQTGPRSFTFTVAELAQTSLKRPLYYAAKWGGFVDQDCDGRPNLREEWDARDVAGNSLAFGDGIPDTYFALTQMGEIHPRLNQIMAQALASANGEAHCDPQDRDGDGLNNDVDEDDDNDGVPDAWETQYGFDPFNAADAAFDNDEDGRSNLEEFQQGTDPTIADTSPVPQRVPALPPLALIALAFTLVWTTRRLHTRTANKFQR